MTLCSVIEKIVWLLHARVGMQEVGLVMPFTRLLLGKHI